MSHNQKDKLKELSSSLMFNLTDEELDLIDAEFNEIVQSINEIKAIDLSNVKPTSMIEKVRLENVLNDDEYETYSQQEVFSNCKSFKNNMVVIKNEK